jgi:hypothetical protein
MTERQVSAPDPGIKWVSIGEQLARIRTIKNTGAQVPICTWCDRILIEGVWLVPLPAVVSAFEGTETFTHTICDQCADELIHE